jgi:hypothetical protein
MFAEVSDEHLQGGKMNGVRAESGIYIYIRRGTAKKGALSEPVIVRRIAKARFCHG